MLNECFWRTSLHIPTARMASSLSTKRNNIFKNCEILRCCCPCQLTCSIYVSVCLPHTPIPFRVSTQFLKEAFLPWCFNSIPILLPWPTLALHCHHHPTHPPITHNSCQCPFQEKLCPKHWSFSFSLSRSFTAEPLYFFFLLVFFSFLPVPFWLFCSWSMRRITLRQVRNSGDGRFPVCRACKCEGPALLLSRRLRDTLLARQRTKALHVALACTQRDANHPKTWQGFRSKEK